MEISAFQKRRVLGLGCIFPGFLDGCVRLPTPDVSNSIMKVASCQYIIILQIWTVQYGYGTGISAMVPTRYYTVSSNDEVDQILRG